MKQINKFLTTLLLTGAGTGLAFADLYVCDFNTEIPTSVPEFKVASNWKHIAESYSDNYGSYYMQYSWKANDGVDNSGALYAYRQYASENPNSSWSSGQIVFDCIVTPVVSGKVTIDVKDLNVSKSYPAFITVYKYDEAKGKRGDLIKEITKADLSSSEFTTITLSPEDGLEEPQRLALRLQYVAVDNFSAENAKIEVEKGISFASIEAKDYTGLGTWYFLQNSDKTVTVKFSVTVTNTGDADLFKGDSNYSVSILNSKNDIESEPTPVPYNLTMGETSEPFDVIMVIPADQVSQFWAESYSILNFSLKENLQGTKTLFKGDAYSGGKSIGYKEYKADFAFTLPTSNSKLSGSYSAQSFGISETAVTKEYKVRNLGLAPMTVNSIKVPDGFTVTCTISGEEGEDPENVTFPYTLEKDKDFDVKITLSENGSHSGDLEIEYQGYGDATATTFSLSFAGNLIAEGTWHWDFNSDTKGSSSVLNCPPGAIAGTGVSGEYSSLKDGIYDNYVKCTSNYNRYLTLPKLHANAGDTFTFDAKRETAGQTVKIYLTSERLVQDVDTFKNLTPVMTINTSDLTTSFAPQSFTVENEGDYYITFEMYGLALDNLVGLSLPDDTLDYDIFIKDFKTGSYADVESIQSGKALTPVVEFYALSEFTKDAYTVSLLLNGESVATATTKDFMPDARNTNKFEFSYTPEVENTTTYECFVRFEFNDDTIYDTPKKSVKVTNESYFAFGKSVSPTAYSAPNSDPTPISFGKTNDNTASVTYKIANWGTKPLTVKSITVPEGFSVDPTECVVPAKSAQDVTIAFNASEAGEYSGTVDIIYVDNDGNDVTYQSPGISGTMLDPTKWYANFDDNKWPAGTAAQSNMRLYSTGTYSAPNYCVSSTSSQASGNNMFITPLLHADAGEQMVFEAYNRTSSTYSTRGLAVYAAKNRNDLLKKNDAEVYENAILLGKWTTEDEGDDKLEYNVRKNYSVTVPEAGDYYIGFEVYNYSSIDEITGLTPVSVPNEVMMESYSIPSEGMQNKEISGSVSLRSLLNKLEDGSYTVKSYVDGKESMSTAGVAMEVKNFISTSSDWKATEVPVSFRSPKAGTFPVYFEVIGEGINITTDPVEVTFAEEVASNETAIAGPSRSTAYDTPFRMNYQTSECVALYPASEISLSGGEKISSIAIKGYCNDWTPRIDSANPNIPTVKVYFEWTDDLTQTSPTYGTPYDHEAMTLIYDNLWNGTALGSSSNYEDLIKINFDTPIEYQSGKGIRILFISECATYSSTVGANFEVSKSLKNSYGRMGDKNTVDLMTTSSWTQKYNPVLYLNLVVDNMTVSGVVVGADDAPVENATVRLVSEDGDNIQYETTTNAAGEYTINVIQNSRDYTIEAIAGDKETFEERVNVANESKVIKLELLDVILISDDADNSEISGEAVIRLQKSLNQGFNVISLPMSLSGDEVEAIFGEEAYILEFEGETVSGAATVINFKEVDGKAMTGGKPYLLFLPDASRDVEFRTKDTHATMETETTDATAFLATSKRTPIADKMFILSEDNFINPERARNLRAAEQTIPAYSGYIKADNAQSVNFTTSAGIETAVEEIEIDEFENETIYDLNGLRVKNPDKGLYIINGKAVLVK